MMLNLYSCIACHISWSALADVLKDLFLPCSNKPTNKKKPQTHNRVPPTGQGNILTIYWEDNWREELRE